MPENPYQPPKGIETGWFPYRKTLWTALGLLLLILEAVVIVWLLTQPVKFAR